MVDPVNEGTSHQHCPSTPAEIKTPREVRLLYSTLIAEGGEGGGEGEGEGRERGRGRGGREGRGGEGGRDGGKRGVGMPAITPERFIRWPRRESTILLSCFSSDQP